MSSSPVFSVEFLKTSVERFLKVFDGRRELVLWTVEGS